VIAWHTGAAWFDALMDALSTRSGEEARRRARVAPDTLLRVARADWLAADAKTGRGLATAHETVAAALGMSSKTVQRSRGLLEVLGFAVTIVEGRYLTVAERKAAKETHGGRQVRAASLRALTMPRSSSPVQNVYLPRRGDLLLHPLVKENSSKRADARKKAPITPRSKKRKSRATANVIETPRPIAIQRLAADLVRQVRWLDTGQHVGALCTVLQAAGLDGARWSARGLIDTMDRFVGDRGMKYPDSTQNPLGFLRWVLSAAIDPATPTPDERRAQIADERRERAIQQARQRQLEAEHAATIDHEEVARIIAASHAEIASRNRARALSRSFTSNEKHRP